MMGMEKHNKRETVAQHKAVGRAIRGGDGCADGRVQ